jgi:hypothetical protein
LQRDASKILIEKNTSASMCGEADERKRRSRLSQPSRSVDSARAPGGDVLSRLARPLRLRRIGPAAVLAAAIALMLPAAPRTGTSTRTLAGGRLHLPAALGFGQPGFHEVLVAAGRLPRRLPPAKGLRLVVSLRDLGRPGQTCSSEHPLSGCATVDWSDDPGRPKVPRGGVFTNALTLRLVSGTRTYYLRANGTLSRTPEPFRPG